MIIVGIGFIILAITGMLYIRYTRNSKVNPVEE